jgi:hypothetical protein
MYLIDIQILQVFFYRYIYNDNYDKDINNADDVMIIMMMMMLTVNNDASAVANDDSNNKIGSIAE